MSIYFDFKTINELKGDNYNFYRQQREFTLDELSQYNGRNGKPAYVAIEGVIYDVSNEPAWSEGKHMGILAGEDLTEQFNSCHGMNEILVKAPKVGILTDDSDMESGFYRCANRQIKQNTSKFKPDDWIRYIDPLVNYAMRESNQQGMDARRSYQRYIILGVLVGLGKTPQEAINQLQEWQTTGASQILKSTGTGTSGGMGTSGGFGGTGTSTGTSGGMGTSGGFGGTGTGTGTTGGMGTGGGFGGTGTGTGTSGGIGTSGGFGGTGIGTGTSGGMGTSGGFGGTGTGTGTSGGIGTSGGFGGTGTGTGTTGGMGTSGGFGGTGTGRTSGGYETGHGTQTSNNIGRRDRLYFE